MMDPDARICLGLVAMLSLHSPLPEAHVSSTASSSSSTFGQVSTPYQPRVTNARAGSRLKYHCGHPCKVMHIVLHIV